MTSCMTNLSNEQWRPIPGWEEHYEVSDHGRVRTKKYDQRMMTLHEWDGYLLVWLRKGGTVHKKYRIHRLVALTFLPIPEEESDVLVVNHKDRNRQNNHVTNLEWATYSENTHHYHHDNKLKAGNVDMPF